MSLRIRHDMQPKQSPSTSLKLNCYTCGLDGNLKLLEAQNKYILTMLCPKLFCRTKLNTQYLICLDCEVMILRIKQFQARLIRTYVTREGVTSTAKGPSTLKRTGIETIDMPTQGVPGNQPALKEILIAPVKLEPETIEIKIENEECVDYDKVIQPSTSQQETGSDSTDTASETDMLMNDDPLKTPIQKNNIKFVKIDVPPEKAVKNALIAPNAKFNNRPERVINVPKEKPIQAYREPVKVPNLGPNKESVPKLVAGRGRRVPVAVTDVGSAPITVESKVTILNVVKGKQSVPDIKNTKGSISSLSKSEENIITQIVSSNPNPVSDQVNPDCEQRLGIYGYEDDEVKCKVLSRTELKAFRDKKASGLFKGSKYKCEMCVEKFNSQENLDEHNKKHDVSRGNSVCAVCKQRFPDENNRKEHYKRHFIIFECLKCEYQNFDRIRITDHFRRKHEVSSFYCKKCNAVFKKFNEKRKHMLHVHSKRRTCEECNKTFLSLSLLKTHIANAHRSETIECSICKKKIRKHYLAKHMKNTHMDNRVDSAYCDVCETTFKSQQTYEKHLRTSLKHNKVEEIGVKCDHCDKYFPSTSSLKNHREEINGVSHTCDICNKEFKRKRLLANHIRVVHMRQKPQFKPRICEYCGKSFSNKKGLVQHINKHLGRRPLVCKDCGATFIYSAALFTHRRLVHKVKRRYEMTS